MSIELEIEQYESELKYSKRGIIKLLKERSIKLNRFIPELVSKINKYMVGKYWTSKEDYLTAVCMANVTVTDIAEEIILAMVKNRETSIQNVANDIGNLYSKEIADVFIRVQIGSDLLSVCEGIGYNLVRTEDSLLFVSDIKLSSDTQVELAKFMYQPPLVTKPLHISNNFQSGYLTYNDSVVLGSKEKSHNKPVRLDVINILNNIEFVLDKETCNKVHKSKNELEGQNLINWNQYIKEQDMLIEEYKDKEFHFNHKLDSRQRIYSQGHHINFQGDSYNKCMVNLAKFEKVELD